MAGRVFSEGFDLVKSETEDVIFSVDDFTQSHIPARTFVVNAKVKNRKLAATKDRCFFNLRCLEYCSHNVIRIPQLDTLQKRENIFINKIS